MFAPKMAFIILPLRGKDGNRLTAAHAALREAILCEFDGYIQALVTAVWCTEEGEDATDDSLKYEFLAADTARSHTNLVAMAAEACRAAGQDWVLIQTPSGRLNHVMPDGEVC
jgi:hypothetical protein